MSKGGSTTSSAEIPEWLENAGIQNINRANAVSQIGYTPYYGPEVAAFNPMQLQSMKTTGDAASAFGLAPQGFDATAGIPTPTNYAGGIQGYSSMPLYNESMAAFTAARPAQANAINSMFIDPFTGVAGSSDFGATVAQQEQMMDRDPVAQADYSININNTAAGGAATGTGGAATGTGGSGTGGLGGTGGAATSDSQGTYDAIYNQTTSNDLTGGDTFTGDDGGTYEVGYGEGQVDSGLANAVVDSQSDQAVYDAIYPQASSNDLTNGDTFTGNDGKMYTVGGGEGQVDAGLANAVIAAGAATTTPLPDSNITTDYLWDYNESDAGNIEGYDLENGLPPANPNVVTNQPIYASPNEQGQQTVVRDQKPAPNEYNPAQAGYSSSGVVDPIYSNSQAVGNIAEAGVQGFVNNGILGMGYKALTDKEIIPATGSKDALVSELSNADARPRTGLLSPQFDDLNVARDNLMDLISSKSYNEVYDLDGDGTLNLFDTMALNDEARKRGVKLTDVKKNEVDAITKTAPTPNSTTSFGTKGSKAEVNEDGTVTYNQKFWANQLKAGVSQADLELAQKALQDPSTPWNDAYSDVAINGTDWFKGLGGVLTAKQAAQALLNQDAANKSGAGNNGSKGVTTANGSVVRDSAGNAVKLGSNTSKAKTKTESKPYSQAGALAAKNGYGGVSGGGGR
tara:strand:+ start:52 stop:2100 length:2049 start_codon:yes stop_codon:yes gene_type:complete